MDKDSEEEKEGLVHGGEVDAGVEGDEEHQLDEEAGVDEDVGEAGAEPHEDAGRGGVLGRVDNTLRHDIMTHQGSQHFYLLSNGFLPTIDPSKRPNSRTWEGKMECQ